MIKAVFFDFDGVLTPEATGTTSIVNYITEHTGINSTLFETEYRKFNADLLMGYITHEQIWGDLCNALGQEIPIDVLIDSFLDTELDTEMLEYAKQAQAKGYKVGIITDNKADRIQTIVDRHGFNEIFNPICVSASLGASKSGAEIFMEALGKVDAEPEECVFIDNNPDNLVVPEEMGMHVIHFDHDKRDHIELLTQLRKLGVEI